MTCRAVFYMHGDCQKMAAAAADLVEYFDEHPEWPKNLKLELAGEITPEDDALVKRTRQELWTRGVIKAPPGWSLDDVDVVIGQILRKMVEAMK